ncbi:MAG: acyl transferase [Sphingobacteriaceae bacterium]|nr:acyl transferase [Sphingobacteriaceae bacterium]
MNSSLSKDIFTIKNLHGFEEKALEVFQYQAVHNPIYKSFIEHLGIAPQRVVKVAEIPFLPISFFKQHAVTTSDKTEQVFSSSGTTGMQTSKHYVHNVSLYEESYRSAFKLFYGDISQYTLLALLPSYAEREGSSLIYMVDDLLQQAQAGSGYYLHNHQELFETLENLKKLGKPTILLGVTYALLDFVEQFPINFSELIVMETGGMKGKRKELIREELHELLCRGFGVANIHSEYGMTELLSQAYSKRGGIFTCPPWMQVYIRDTNDPFQLIEAGKTGGINIIDLANVHSCAFIATQDLGKLTRPNQFEVLGRFDASDIRGCNLLVQ